MPPNQNVFLSRGYEWEGQVGRQDCMQSRQDYIIAVKKKRRETDSEEDSPGGAARRADVCGVM